MTQLEIQVQKDLSNYRKSYDKEALTKASVANHPMEQFQKWFSEIESAGGLEEPNAMTISTLGLDGFPKNRIVLMKKFSVDGFIFYTNYESEKGRAISQDPKVCLSFFWPNLERQVIVKGRAEKVDESTSETYFKSRPRGSKLGAAVSDQSSVISSREILESRLKELENTYEKKQVPRPKNWGGYLVRPQSMEFWQGRPNRLHDRIRYTLSEGSAWKTERLAP